MSKSTGLGASFSERTARVRTSQDPAGSSVALVVLGMHRSGTSALTRILSLSGYALPKTLMEPSSDNEEGFWESVPIADFNDFLLAQTGSSWDDPFGFQPGRPGASALNVHLERAVELIRSEFPERRAIVLKDPRITVLYDFWVQALRASGYEPAPVVCVRNPMEVAASLTKRNGFPANKSLLVWLSYQLAAERATRDGPRAFVMYEDVLADWRGALDHLEQSLGMPLERRDLHAEVLIERFLRPDLRHHKSGEAQLAQAKNQPAWLAEAYAWFSAAARTSNPDPSALSPIVAEYARQRRWFGPVIADLTLRLSDAQTDAASRIAALERRIVETNDVLQAQIDARDAQILETNRVLGSEIDARDAQILENNRVLGAEIDARDARIVETNRVLQAEIDARDARIVETNRVLRAEIDAREAQLLEANRIFGAQIDARDQEITRLQASAAADIALAREQLAALDAEFAAARRAYQEQIDVRDAATLELRAFHEAETARWTRDRERDAALARGREESISHLEKRLRDVVSQGQAARAELVARHAEAIAQLTARAVAERDELHGRILEISRTYETQRQQREEEVGDEIRHALDVIRDLESDNLRLRAMVIDKTQAHARLAAEHDAVTHSTSWRATRPLRMLGARAPRVARVLRATARAGWSLVTLRFLRSGSENSAEPAEFNAASPGTSSAAAALQPSSSLPAQQPGPWAGRPSLDPEPIAKFLIAEQTDHEGVEVWRAHCRQFPLPIDPRSSEKPQLEMSDAQASDWIETCRAAGEKLRTFSGPPDVSIIIPVYNQLAFTLSAIASIYAQRTRFTYEIIVGDDGSSDQTRTLNDGSLPRVRIARHGRNLGFIGNCNAAAAQARGRMLVFLNNDVVVLPGWLDELVAPLAKDNGVGFVGSKLLYADATLQEAGGIVWRDGSAWNYGRGQDPRDPRYCYAREADYVSGASIAVPTDLWRRLEGFDGKTYEVAYYEDVDLAFRVRQAGLKVLFQPLSALVHFEGASSGVDLTQGMKKHQVENGRRFLERWRDTLASHRPNAVEPLAECERMVRGRMLVIDAVTPTPDRDAGSLVMVEMLRCFQDLGWRVSFIPEDNLAHMPRDTAALQRQGIEAIYWPYLDSVASFLEKRGPEFDIILMSRMRTGEKHLEAVRRFAPQARVIFNTVDLHFLREAREASLTTDGKAHAQAARTKAIELGVVKSSDLTIVHSTIEQDLLRSETPDSDVFLFPWVADPHPGVVRIDGRRDVVFVGGFRHAPNVDGLRWFLSEIWPLVRAQAADATLKVIGAEAPPEIEAHNGSNGVTIMGWVADLDSELARARVSVAPLRYGAGVKGKVVSSLRVGLPVVCTTIASEGMGLVSGRDVMVEDQARQFADAVTHLLSDDAAWLSLSRNGVQFVADNYARDVARKRVGDMIRRVGLGRLLS